MIGLAFGQRGRGLGRVAWGFALLVGFLVTLVLPLQARGDAPVFNSAKYRIFVIRNSVLICIDNTSNALPGHIHNCGSTGQSMIRVNLGDQSAMKLAMDCAEPTSDCRYCSKCYLDECVPPGTYRYGAIPEVPHCGEYYGEVKVTNPLLNCTRSPGFSAPMAYTPAPAWSTAALAPRPCDFGSQDGCQMAGVSLVVLEMQVLVGLAALFVWVRRRRRTRGL